MAKQTMCVECRNEIFEEVAPQCERCGRYLCERCWDALWGICADCDPGGVVEIEEDEATE